MAYSVRYNLNSFFVKEKKRITTAFIMVFLWGLVAHAYGFLNLTLSHDSLAEFFVSRSDIEHRISLGRFVVPIYQIIFHGRVNLPWLNGILSLCWLSIAVWCVSAIFSFDDKLHIALIAGIYTANITVTALAATYIHDLDADIFAVMLATASVFFWFKGGKWGLLGIPLLVGALGCYQSMLSVAVTLMMILSILALVRGEKAINVVRKGLFAIGIIIASGIVYLFLVKVVCFISGIELKNSYNGLTRLFNSKGGFKEQISLLITTYSTWLKYFLRSKRPIYVVFPLHVFLFLPTIIVVINILSKKTLPVINKVLILILGVLLPFGMNISCFADGGMVHDLMLYPANLIYLLVLLLADWYVDEEGGKGKLPLVLRGITIIVLTVILIVDVQTANEAYVKKNLEREATLSLMTAVNSDIDNTEGYVPGETEVVFIGSTNIGVSSFFPYVSSITGLGSANMCNSYTAYCYYKYILQRPLKRSTDNIAREAIDDMASYPERGYIKWCGDVLVVKLSD